MGFSDTLGRTWEENILFTVLIELTYRCNLNCSFCYNDTALKGAPLDTAQYKTLFHDLARMGTMNLVFSGGEPLAHPDFFTLGRHARDLGFAVRVKSNGHALGERLARRLKRELDPFNIDISLHGACAGTHDRQTRVPGSFERLIHNLDTLRNLGVRVVLNCTLTRWNEDEIEAMQAIADGLGVNLNFNTEVSIRDNGDTSPLAIGPTAEGLTRLFRFQAARTPKRTSKRRPGVAAGSPDTPNRACGAASSSLTVDPFGTVYPCVKWRRPLGNLHHRSVSEIWAGDGELRRVRDWSAAARQMLEREGPAAFHSGFCPGQAASAHGSPVVFYATAKRQKEFIEEWSADRNTR